jgi:hypothetical protein
MTKPAPAADSGASINDTALPQFTDSQSDTAVTAVPRAAPAAPQTAAGGPLKKNGLLMVSITPAEAQVFADEKPFSFSDIDSGKRMITGTHFIVATANGYEPYWGSLDIAANKTSTLSIRLVPIPENHGYLRISASPPSSVYIDGVFRGAGLTTLTISLKAGEHYVTLRCRGHKALERTVIIDSNGTAVIEATLEPSRK